MNENHAIVHVQLAVDLASSNVPFVSKDLWLLFRLSSAKSSVTATVRHASWMLPIAASVVSLASTYWLSLLWLVPASTVTCKANIYPEMPANFVHPRVLAALVQMLTSVQLAIQVCIWWLITPARSAQSDQANTITAQLSPVTFARL